MSIEAKIDALIAALNANTAALLAKGAIATAGANKAGGGSGAPIVGADQVNAEARAKIASPAQPAKAPAPAAPAKPAAPAALNYMKDVQPVALKLVNADRAKIVEILGKYGVKLGTELKADQLPAFLADVKAALAEKGVAV